MAYRNPLAWDRCKRPGLFKSDPNAELPMSEEYRPIDWLSEDMTGTGHDAQYSDLELDLMMQELQ